MNGRDILEIDNLIVSWIVLLDHSIFVSVGLLIILCCNVTKTYKSVLLYSSLEIL